VEIKKNLDVGVKPVSETASARAHAYVCTHAQIDGQPEYVLPSVISTGMADA